MKTISPDKIALAGKIPDLGDGGKTIGWELASFASAIKPGGIIVENAPWLGSATAFLAAGAPDGTTIHSHDLWRIDDHWKEKARRFNGLAFAIGDDLLPIWLENVSRVIGDSDVRLVPHRGDILDATWDGTAIDLFVDDISNVPEIIESTMNIFGPSIVPGAWLVMMDWQFPQAQGQRDWFAAHKDEYAFVRTLGPKAGLLRKL